MWGGGGWSQTLQGPKADSTPPVAVATTKTKLKLRKGNGNARGKTARQASALGLQGCNERKPTLNVVLPCTMHTGY